MYPLLRDRNLLFPTTGENLICQTPREHALSFLEIFHILISESQINLHRLFIACLILLEA